MPTFWTWFLRGYGHRPGWRKFANWWLCLHVLVGVLLASLIPVTLQQAANAVLLPLAGVLIGMSFAWAGNAQALLQVSEVVAVSERNAGGFKEYVFTFQAAVLTILTTLVLWGLAGLGLFDRPCFWVCSSWGYYIAKVMLFCAASITLRECWHVVLGAQWMLLAQYHIRRSQSEKRRSHE